MKIETYKKQILEYVNISFQKCDEILENASLDTDLTDTEYSELVIFSQNLIKI